jgi:hypothetical protein
MDMYVISMLAAVGAAITTVGIAILFVYLGKKFVEIFLGIKEIENVENTMD